MSNIHNNSNKTFMQTWQTQRLARQHQQKPNENEIKKEQKDKKKEPKLVLPQLAKVEMKSYKPGS